MVMEYYILMMDKSIFLKRLIAQFSNNFINGKGFMVYRHFEMFEENFQIIVKQY